MVRAFQRVTRADLQVDRATPEERELLASASPPVTSPIAQDYAAWRRSVLWVAAACLVTHTLFELFGMHSFAEDLGPQLAAVIRVENLSAVNWLTRTVVIVLCVGSALTVLAATAWRNVRASLVLARIAWLLMFATPFLIAAVPITKLINLDHLPLAAQTVVRTALGGAFALSFFFSIGPRAVALFPGIIRSALAVKTLLPESPTPGWVILLVGPLYTVFLLVLVTGIIQSQASYYLLGGVLCLILSPLIYVLRRKDLVRPQSAPEAERMVSSTKRLASVFSFAGVLLLAVFVLRRPNLELLSLFGFLTGIVGNVVLLMAVGADFTVGVLRAAHEQQKSFQGSELQASLEQKFAALENLGVAQAPAKPPRVQP